MPDNSREINLTNSDLKYYRLPETWVPTKLELN